MPRQGGAKAGEGGGARVGEAHSSRAALDSPPATPSRHSAPSGSPQDLRVKGVGVCV